MSEADRVRDALESIEDALRDHRDFGPYYDDKEIAEINALRDQFRARLSLTEEVPDADTKRR